MGQHRLHSGRELSLSSFRISGTYNGAMEGSRVSVSRQMLESLQARGVGSVVITPARMPLPAWRCQADLGSRTGARSREGNYESFLTVTWFVDECTLGVDAMVEAILPRLNWEQDAEDYEIEVF